MQVIFHAGAHHTDDDRLLKCLLNNKDDFTRRGVAVPGPGKYRTLLKDTFAALADADPSPHARDILVDAILDDEKADRLILSNSHFFGSPRFALGQGGFYPLAPRRLEQLQALFSSDQVEMFLAICNPATFIPNVLSRAAPQQRREILELNPPHALRWSDLLIRIREAVPDVRLTVWCNEDTPLLWAEIIREMAGLAPGTKIVGGFDLLREIMSHEGMKRFRAYLSQHPDMTDPQKRRVISAFLSKYALEDEIEEELDFPSWTEDLVDQLTDAYDADVERIQKMDGLRVLAS